MKIFAANFLPVLSVFAMARAGMFSAGRLSPGGMHLKLYRRIP